MRESVITVCVLALCLTAGACGESFSTFSTKYPVSFACKRVEPPFNLLGGVGEFVSVRSVGNTLVTVTSDGLKRERPLTEIESKGFWFGLGGLLIGTPALNNDGQTVWAYDLSCPVCDQASSRLSFNSTGVASCAKCGTRFDLNNSGFVISSNSDETRPLYRYRVSQTWDQITVTN